LSLIENLIRPPNSPISHPNFGSNLPFSSRFPLVFDRSSNSSNVLKIIKNIYIMPKDLEEENIQNKIKEVVDSFAELERDSNGKHL